MEKVALKHICEIGNGFAFKSKEYLEDGIPLLRISNINNERVHFNGNPVYVDQKFLRTKADFLVEKGDVVIALSGATTGKYGIYDLDSPCLLNQRLGIIKAQSSKELDSRYFYYYLGILRREVLRMAGGAAQPNISTKELGNFEIPLPPLKIQQKIAAILDEADKLRRLNKKLIKKYEQLSQSLFLEMFGDPVSNLEILENHKLGNVCLKITDGTHHSPEPQSQGFPYVTAKHVKPFKLAFNEKATFISEEAHAEIFKRCSPEYGDVLYIKDGATTGIACINTFKQPISLLSSLALIKPKTGILNPLFLSFWLNHEGVKSRLLSEFMSGAAIKRYTLKKIKSFPITLPEISLQKKFAEHIEEIEKQKTQAQQALEHSEELFNSLLQRAFKGELVK